MAKKNKRAAFLQLLIKDSITFPKSVTLPLLIILMLFFLKSENKNKNKKNPDSFRPLLEIKHIFWLIPPGLRRVMSSRHAETHFPMRLRSAHCWDGQAQGPWLGDVGRSAGERCNLLLRKFFLG